MARRSTIHEKDSRSRWRLGGLIALILWLAPLLAHSQAPPPPSALRNEAFEHAQRAMSGAAASALAQLGARFAAGSDDLAKAVRKRQNLIENWRKADRLLVQAVAAQSGFTNIADMRAEAERLQLAIATSDAELARDFPAYADFAMPRPMSIAATRALLDADEGLVLIISGQKESFVFAVTQEGEAVVRVALSTTDLVPTIKALRRGLNPSSPVVMRSALRNLDDTEVESSNDTDRISFDRTRAHALYASFLAPLEPAIAQKKRLFFVLEAPFDSLPLSLLVTAPPQGSDTDPAALRATPWLIKRHGLVVLPSVASLKALRSGPAMVRAPEPFRGYGAPLIGSAPARMEVATRSAGTPSSVYKGGRVDVEAVRALQPLPKTEGELVRLAQALRAPPDSVRIGAAATVSAVKSDDLSRYRVLAFATHGLLAGELSGLAEPALVFTPPRIGSDEDNGLLTASEAAKLDLAADWVILSACNTAAGDGTPGADGLSGLARAFFFAGARSLLVSHWPVRDDAAARITTETFRALADQPTLGKADAFRQAVLALMADTSDPTLAHPAIWAPFVIVGEGR